MNRKIRNLSLGVMTYALALAMAPGASALSINMADVVNTLQSVKTQLIFFAVVLVAAIVSIVAAMKLPKPKKYMVRSQALVALVLGLAITINWVCFGPMSTLISLATGNGTVHEETTVEANALCEQIADEGIVLLQNKNGNLPLAEGSKLNVFGWASTNPCYGGTGSGALSDAYPTVTLLEGLANAGIETNAELSKFYTDYRADRPVVGMFAQDWTLPEPAADSYTDELIANAKAFSDQALIVITRVGGEGADLPTDMSAVTFESPNGYEELGAGDHYLQLTKSEQDMVDLVCKNFSNVTVVYNGANTMELGWVEDYSQIKSVIWCPGTGQTGFNGLGSIVAGKVNPSGRTTDTFVYDLTAAPWYNNIGSNLYTNMDEFKANSFGQETTPNFVNYVEGIYVGYRFYETAAAEGLIDYGKTVQYPFGYGLSYTSFKQEMGELKEADGVITVDVTVTNTGKVAGKDVVELYYNPPYYPNGIEKSSANLVAFDKTDLLEAGASQTLTLTFKAEDMASYDTYGKGCYVLEGGDYVVSINSDSHTVLDSKTYNVPVDVVYKDGRSTDAEAPSNEFGFAEGNVTYLSRADGFANYAEATAAPASYELAAEYKAAFVNNSNWDPNDHNNADDVMPATGAKNGLTLQDLRGADYDDERWEQLLDQLTVSEMDSIIALGGYQTGAAKSVGKNSTIDCDGPASINNNFTGAGSIGFPSAVMIACTWNEEIAHDFGASIGKMADEMGVSGWYAPAMNNHRSAFAGRNFEYYSEDGLLAGKMAANAVVGAEEYGVYAYIKHFALNDQETNRCNMLCTWSTEQAIREIYLKPFELAVKEGGAKAVMSSFNYIGTTYAGACPELLMDVLRGEWGFRGMVLTDYYGVYGYQDADRCIRNGNDFCLVAYDTETNHVTDTASATGVLAMRQACKNIMYTVVNSRAHDPANKAATPMWKIVAIVIDVLLVALLVFVELKVVRKGYAKRKEEAGVAVESESSKQ